MKVRPWSPGSGGVTTETGLSREIMATNSLTNRCELSEMAKDASRRSVNGRDQRAADQMAHCKKSSSGPASRRPSDQNGFQVVCCVNLR